MDIDSSFDFRNDSNGKDPDSHSPTLRKYHQFLWSKELPNGDFLNIEEIRSTLVYRFNMQTIRFSSDSISNSYFENKKAAHLIPQIPQFEFEEFRDRGSTIGGFTIFPSQRVNGKMTLNGARGLNSKIADRFDLTLECIRRHYLKQDNPLQANLNLPFNRFFFAMFGNFAGYVDFFHFQDLVDSNHETVKFFTRFEKPFEQSPIPQTQSEYIEYKRSALEFLILRNKRIEDWSRKRSN